MLLVLSLPHVETFNNLTLTRALTSLVQDASPWQDQECQKQLGCEFVMSTPSASQMGGARERQIGTIRSVLTTILDQSSRRLDGSSLQTYLYEVMAIIDNKPLTAHFLNDATGPQSLMPNHILAIKTSIFLPPPGEFVKEPLSLQKMV